MKTRLSGPGARPKFAALILAAASAAGLALAFASHSPSGAQTGAGKTSVAARPKRVLVTPDTIAGLPPGKSYVVKVGSGTLVLTGANARNGNNGGGPSAGLTKAGAGTLNVYEFRSDRPIDFGRVLVQTDGSDATEGLEAWLRRHRPADSMTGWPFKRLLVGPAEGIARVEGWKAGTKPSARISCANNFCLCSGSADCLDLASSGSCSSAMTYTGEGSNVTCSCPTR